MNNGKRILIGDNSYDSGRILSKFLADNGFDVVCRRNDISLLKNEILSAKPDVAIIYISATDTSSLTLIEELVASGCSARILAAVFSLSYDSCRDAINAGADRCILLPCAMNNIVNIVSELSCAVRSVPFEPEVISFLSEEYIPAHLKGFPYLATGVGLCVSDPDNLSDITNTLYRKIADIYNTSPAGVERDIRHVALLAHENGSDMRLARLGRSSSAKFDAPLTNYELICLAADAFAEKYGLYR